MSTVVLDNEAIQALMIARHPKQFSVLRHLDSQQRRARRNKRRTSRLVPTTVRAEAAWDRTVRSAADINRLQIQDRPLTTDQANVAARLVAVHGVSPADAHLGATVHACAEVEVLVITSDPDDMALVCPPGTRIVRI